MLQLILYIIIVSCICMMWGVPVLMVYKKSYPDKEFWLRSTIGYLCFLFFSGLLTLSFISSWLCLFAPLKFTYLLLLTSVLIVFLIFKRKQIRNLLTFGKIKFSTLEIAFAVIVVLIFLIAGSLNPVNYDTQIYHVQIIRWVNEYGTVPGLANLFPRFGLGSNWFNLISFFKIPIFKYQNFTYLNITSVIWFFLWLLNNWKFHSTAEKVIPANRIMSHFYLFIILFCFFEWELFRDAASSTNYDFIVTALSIAAISYLLEILLFTTENKWSPLVFIVICLSIIPFKLSGATIIVLLAFYLFLINKIKYWLFSLLAGLLIVLPYLIKNFIITGYPLYPSTISFTNPDWQLSKAMTNYLRQYIQTSNRFYNVNGFDFKHIPELMEKPWIKIWWNGILIQQKFIVIFSMSSVLIFFLKSKLAIDYIKLRILFFILLSMAAAWFFSAPSPRFGYGTLLVLAFFPICFFVCDKISITVQKPVIIFTIFISCWYLYKKSVPLQNNPENLIHTVNLIQPPLNTIYIKGIKFNLPEIINNGWMRNCFNSDLPCISQENKYLLPRGNSLKDGFKMDPLPDSIFIRNYIY